MKNILLIAGFSVLFFQCAHVSREMGYAEVGQMLEERTGAQHQWRKGAPAPSEIIDQINQLLQKDLTEQSIIQLALLNNQDLQAAYEELGIAQADLIQAGLLRNPSLGFAIRFPEGAAGVVNKPVKKETLLPAVQKVLSGEKL